MTRYNRLLDFIARHYRTLLPFLTPGRVANIIRALLEMQRGEITCESRPFIYKIEPCSLCNLRCASCSLTMHDGPIREQRLLDLADLEQLIEHLQPYAIRLSLSEQGEPLLNKHIYAMIAAARQRRISTSISTNFTVYDIEAILDSGLTVLEPCLDGFTQECYSHYRRGGDVEAVKSGIRQLMLRRRQRGLRYPIVDVNVVLFDHIEDELPLIERFLRDCGVERITFRPEVASFNRPETRWQPQVNGGGPRRCFWLYLGMMIKPDGSVLPCCGKGFDAFSYGNIFRDSLDDIWNNRFYRFSRALFEPGPDLPYDREMEGLHCLSCPMFTRARGMAPPST